MQANPKRQPNTNKLITSTMKIVILIPVYNDWAALSMLLARLSETLQGRTEEFLLVLIDDGSEDQPPVSLPNAPNVFSEATLLRLRCNQGHQRAIAVGLAWLHHQVACDGVVIMDGDGEDTPEDVPRLLDRFAESGGMRAVFAERTRRSEGFQFTFFYKLYQMGHRLLTGLSVKIGNFSVLPTESLRSLVISGHLWNHYAATVVRLRLGMTTVPTKRGMRYQGKSKMNFVSLVRHGLSAIAVHSELVATRLLVATGAFCVIGLVLLSLCLFIRLFSSLAVPGWVTYANAFIVIILIQILSTTFSFAIYAFSDLSSMSSLPVRDYAYFIDASHRLPMKAEAIANAVGTSSSTHGEFPLRG